MPVLPIMLSVGTLGMTISALSRRNRFGISVSSAVSLMLILTTVGVVGACSLYRLEAGEWGGVSFYGSVFLIPVLMPLLGLVLRLKPNQTMDLCGPCVAIMIGCLRVGCFITGCCGGWTICIGNVCFAWPTQAIDSIGDFAILLWLLSLETKQSNQGELYPLFMLSYSVMRFFIEFLRDTTKNIMFLSQGQVYALTAVVISIIWLSILRLKEKTL